LHQIGYHAVEIRVGDGSRGWAEHAPFDKIVVTAGANEPPPMLLQQLKQGGRMVLPMGADDEQVLTAIDKDADGRIRVYESISVQFTRLETVI
jgi:protein-L-isoaspartate(D-aspartate) O-methyltransferase